VLFSLRSSPFFLNLRTENKPAAFFGPHFFPGAIESFSFLIFSIFTVLLLYVEELSTRASLLFPAFQTARDYFSGPWFFDSREGLRPQELRPCVALFSPPTFRFSFFSFWFM